MSKPRTNDPAPAAEGGEQQTGYTERDKSILACAATLFGNMTPTLNGMAVAQNMMMSVRNSEALHCVYENERFPAGSEPGDVLADVINDPVCNNRLARRVEEQAKKIKAAGGAAGQ